MTLRLRWIAFGLITAALLMACKATPKDEKRAEAADDVDVLNSSPQKEYPEFTIEAQKAAMRRIEELRRKTRVEGLRQKVPPADWIAMAYHGLVLDANFDVIPIDAATISKIQESIFSVLRAKIGEKVARHRGSDLSAAFLDQNLRGADQFVVRTAVLEAMLDEADQNLKDRYAWRHRLISRGARSNLDAQALSPRGRNKLRQFGLDADVPVVPDSASMYIENCRAQGVPIPPDWPNSSWISQGALSLVFISTGFSAEVFAYKDPVVPGVCYALPRRDSAGSIQLLGIICQSASTGKACFWDNKTIDNEPLTGVNLTLDVDTIGNGMTLNENCTNCHRGDNVYTIHPGTALDLGRSTAIGGPYETDPAVRYAPIAQMGWSNPGPLVLPAVSAGQSSCAACHGFPETRSDYCAAVLQSAARLTMPPFGTSRAGWPSTITNAKYTDHITQLAACP